MSYCDLFKDSNMHKHVIEIKYRLDKLHSLEGGRHVTLWGQVFGEGVVASVKSELGWYVGKLFGVDIYSTHELPLKNLTTEERLTRLEGLLDVEN